MLDKRTWSHEVSRMGPLLSGLNPGSHRWSPAQVKLLFMSFLSECRFFFLVSWWLRFQGLHETLNIFVWYRAVTSYRGVRRRTLDHV